MTLQKFLARVSNLLESSVANNQAFRASSPMANPGRLLGEVILVKVVAVAVAVVAVLQEQGTQAAINNLELSCRHFN
jgi:hypothetical protein